MACDVRRVCLGLALLLFLVAVTPGIVSSVRRELTKALIVWNGSGARNREIIDLGPETKVILYATPFFQSPSWGFGEGRNPFLSHKCPVNDCVATTDLNYMEHFSGFDAVLFHLENVQGDMQGVLGMGREFFDKQRSPHQRFVSFILESPQQMAFSHFHEFSDFFNWTMGYRMDSDIIAPYGSIKQNVPELDITEARQRFKPSDKMLSQALPKDVLWLVSHCHTFSEREKYVAELKKYIQVDIFGQCSGEVCRRASKCEQQISTDYKFYLSFENSVCNGYATEKFFSNMKKNMIPIVLGGANYSALAPPHSFIDVRDFTGPKELAEYLRYLSGNPEEYYKYFWWKEHYSVVPNLQWRQGLCQICEKLHNSSEPSKQVPDLRAWLFDKPSTSEDEANSQCLPKGSHYWSNFRISEPWVDVEGIPVLYAASLLAAVLLIIGGLDRLLCGGVMLRFMLVRLSGCLQAVMKRQKYELVKNAV